MSFTFDLVSLLTLIASITTLYFSSYIFRRIFNQKEKRPWLYISISAIIIAIKKIIEIFNIKILTNLFTTFIVYTLEFIGIIFISYAMFLEYLVIRYYKGRFIRIKFIPVQEGTLTERDIELNVSDGEGYLAYKKSKDFILKEFSKAVKTGYEGFLITETPPKIVREKYSLPKIPIAWITSTENFTSEISNNLTQNSDIIEPIRLNDIITNIDFFITETNKPFIIIEINEIIRVNNYMVVAELLNYINNKIKLKNGILIAILNRDVDSYIINNFLEILKELN